MVRKGSRQICCTKKIEEFHEEKTMEIVRDLVDALAEISIILQLHKNERRIIITIVAETEIK